MDGRLIRLLNGHRGGYEGTADPVEAAGIARRTRELIAMQISWCCWLFAADEALPPDGFSIFCKTYDQTGYQSRLGLPACLMQAGYQSQCITNRLGNFKTEIASTYDGLIGHLDPTNSVYFNVRHLELLKETVFHLQQVLAIQSSDIEMVGFELDAAAQGINEILGKIEPDEVLEQIFSHFCVGKLIKAVHGAHHGFVD